MSNQLLSCQKIEKTFGGVRALKGVNFSLHAGEVHALVGENGAGKSTLIKIISGALLPDAGDIFVRGQKVNISSPRMAQEMGISTVYQDPLIYPALSVVENIFLGREIRTPRGNIDWKAQEKRAQELFQSLGISATFLRKPIGELSVGLQQLVLIAKALAYESKIIIFDEPTAILTEHEAERLFDIIKQLKEQGVGIIYISHRLEEIFQIADRVTVLRDGTVVGCFPIQEVKREKIIELMAGKLLVEEIERAGRKSDQPLLVVNSLTKAGIYRNISFEVFPGEVLGFFGLVGSGRTEVAQTIFGIIQPDQGEILYQGKPFRPSSPLEAMKRGIAYLPEDRKEQGLFLILDVGYNLTISILPMISGPLGTVDFRKEREQAQRYIKELNIKTPSIRTKVFSLSGGNQQKVVLGKWLGVEPQVLILDEPTRGIDVAAKSEVHHIIAQLSKQGMGIMVISSELPEILKLSDRIIVMHEGVITGAFSREEASSEKILRAATGERMLQR
ncbi:sugar ABC transporter ATP-binding protein [Thermatribacter velox]|uniref:Sugar ABC transporter ATP-binding protein n=1 Tax=Thermatribacter velox TaxID=3039681 RepID=A0ABZ2YAN1_9BACT